MVELGVPTSGGLAVKARGYTGMLMYYSCESGYPEIFPKRNFHFGVGLGESPWMVGLDCLIAFFNKPFVNPRTIILVPSPSGGRYLSNMFKPQHQTAKDRTAKPSRVVPCLPMPSLSALGGL